MSRRLQSRRFEWGQGQLQQGISLDNPVENAIRPIALGGKNWLFVGSQQAGERAAHLMSLIESAKLKGHDAWAYLKDVLDKLPTWPNSRLSELLPHRWVAPANANP